ncbi:hypothetical protein OEA41_000705 [Lepraria neglecta]|uniref:CYTH domain-containing protein n=1 Tax=Lepraria neglecta TaxID=209136 RepID=A0AAD9ZIN4_9LECA|nr:hypothetical protein OEA41_000705 [Lepraria neglecta]
MLMHLGTSPRPFKKLHELNLESLRDTYYEKGNQLSSTGLWVRKRQQVVFPHINPLLEGELTPGAVSWQAKQKRRVAQTEDKSQILQMVRSRFPKCPCHKKSFGLDVLAEFEAIRYTFLADDKFTIVLDNTDFDHQVGEVELVVEPEDVDEAHTDIDAFLEESAWFYDTSNPKGKLTAYFEKFGYPKEKVQEEPAKAGPHPFAPF